MHATIPVEAASEVERAPAFACDRLLDQLGEAVIASDAAHRIVYWNAAAESLLGWTTEEVIGKTDSELLQTKTSAGQTAEIIAGLLRNRPWSAEVMVRRRDRSTLPARITASALRGADGAVAGYVAVVTDLRAVREHTSRREAMAAMDAVANMARGIARELTEAVARIEAGIRATLARVSLQERSRAQLDDALRTVDATAALAAQLLAVGREAVIKPARTDLPAVVRSGQAALSLLCGMEITVELELDPATLAAWVDNAVASQVLLNLAANACAAMPEGGRLTIATKNADLSRGDEERLDVPSGQWVVLEIRDTRVHVPPLDRIFEPYAEAAVPPGMGLAAAHGLVTLSGGRLTAEASPTEGLVFRAYFRPAMTV
jgi:PAS domain S-box-containing protein